MLDFIGLNYNYNMTDKTVETDMYTTKISADSIFAYVIMG